jgi:hypothetical protein
MITWRLFALVAHCSKDRFLLFLHSVHLEGDILPSNSFAYLLLETFSATFLTKSDLLLYLKQPPPSTPPKKITGDE